MHVTEAASLFGENIRDEEADNTSNSEHVCHQTQGVGVGMVEEVLPLIKLLGGIQQ